MLTTEKLCNVTNSTEFWSVIRQYPKKKIFTNYISINNWISYLKNFNPSRPKQDNASSNPHNPDLDDSITLNELLINIKKLSNNKTPGLDLLLSEFFKKLPLQWLHYVQNLLNNIMETENFPEKLCTSKLIMIFKKGDSNDPRCYLPISILNSFLKLFTQILASRLSKWLEQNAIIPEMQSGFRSGRGCLDNIFSLTAIIQNALRSHGRYLFVTFIDFRQAFDSINHELLWNKLSKIEVIGKFINVIKNLYRSASQCISVNNELSESIPIIKGVLQGDNMSSTLFNLYLSDIETHFRSKKLSGVSIDNNTDVILLAYADDIVLFSDSQKDMQIKLHTY